MRLPLIVVYLLVILCGGLLICTIAAPVGSADERAEVDRVQRLHSQLSALVARVERIERRLGASWRPILMRREEYSHGHAINVLRDRDVGGITTSVNIGPIERDADDTKLYIHFHAHWVSERPSGWPIRMTLAVTFLGEQLSKVSENSECFLEVAGSKHPLVARSGDAREGLGHAIEFELSNVQIRELVRQGVDVVLHVGGESIPVDRFDRDAIHEAATRGM